MDIFLTLQLSANLGRQQRDDNNNITRNSSRSDILTLLIQLSADAKSAGLLRVPSLTKVKVRNFPLLHFPKWLCLVHGQHAMSLRHVKRSVICKCKIFMSLRYSQWSVLSFNSTKCQMLGLYSQFSFYKMPKALQVLIFTYSILEKRPKALLTMFLIDVDRLTLPRPLRGVIFKHIF